MHPAEEPAPTRPLRVVVASRNPVKIAATQAAFSRVYSPRPVECLAVEVPSGVAHQPMTDAETRRGARQRVAAAEQALPTGDFWVGLEGGVETLEGSAGEPELWAFAWVAVRWPGGAGEARSATFRLPPAVAHLVWSGVELGEADDRVFGRSNSKSQDGAVGLLTLGWLDRAALYQPAVLLALIPYLQPSLFQDPG